MKLWMLVCEKRTWMFCWNCSVSCALEISWNLSTWALSLWHSFLDFYILCWKSIERVNVEFMHFLNWNRVKKSLQPIKIRRYGIKLDKFDWLEKLVMVKDRLKNWSGDFIFWEIRGSIQKSFPPKIRCSEDWIGWKIFSILIPVLCIL